MIKDRYFAKCICDIIVNKDKVILANKINGNWIKIPIECYKVLEYSAEKRLSLNSVFDVFSLDEDKKYFEKLLDKLQELGFISSVFLEKFKWNKINSITFSPTNRCNLHCDYCCVDSKTENLDYLDTNDIKIIIQKIRNLNPNILTISGGEPLLRNDFFEILEYTKKNFNGKIVLATNATLIKANQIDRIIDGLHAIEISLDGYDEHSCSKIRGKGVFVKVVKIVKLIKAKGFNNISLSMVVGKNNIDDIEKFKNLCSNLGVKYIIRNFVNIGRGNKNWNNYLDHKFDISYVDKDDYKDRKSLYVNMCKAGVNQLSIDYKGDVYPCPNLEYKDLKMFNILEEDYEILNKILNRELKAFKVFDEMKPVNMNTCSDCKISAFCSTCPAQMYILKKNKEMFIRNCDKMKKILSPIIW